MMAYRIKAFGIARDILGGRDLTFEIDGQTVGDLRQALLQQFPALRELRSLLIAVNNSYAPDSQTLSEHDEIAIIPPVSGG